MDFALCDLHTHTFYSDGVLSPIELIRFAAAAGYQILAITDHVSASNMERVFREIQADALLAERYWDITVIAGVELTNIPAGAVSELARRARELGAELVVVHGETIVEPVEPGTNRAAVSCPDVDILAHPGLITLEEARLAEKNGVYLEISPRRDHSLTNGHVVKMAGITGAKLLLNSDAHEPEDLLRPEFALKVGLGAGLNDEEFKRLLFNSREITERILAKKKQRPGNAG